MNGDDQVSGLYYLPGLDHALRRQPLPSLVDYLPAAVAQILELVSPVEGPVHQLAGGEAKHPPPPHSPELSFSAPHPPHIRSARPDQFLKWERRSQFWGPASLSPSPPL